MERRGGGGFSSACLVEGVLHAKENIIVDGISMYSMHIWHDVYLRNSVLILGGQGDERRVATLHNVTCKPSNRSPIFLQNDPGYAEFIAKPEKNSQHVHPAHIRSCYKRTINSYNMPLIV